MLLFEEEDEDPTEYYVLNASIRDLRYFAALIRGVNFGTRALITITKSGFIVNVEEARTLLGTAYIFADIFDEYIYDAEIARATAVPTGKEYDGSNTAIEVPINAIVDCLNVFGTAGAANTNLNTKKTRKFKKFGEPVSDGEQNDGTRRRPGSAQDLPDVSANGRIDDYFGSQKKTGLRICYAGAGFPLTLLVSEENGVGPTAKCKINTFDPEPQLELPFDIDDTILKIILKSSWLREALSELDPSCEKLSIIGNPPPPDGRAPRLNAPPRLRLKAVGPFGTTEMDYPNDKEVLETCDCEEPVSFSYKFAHISKALRALQSSTKTSLRINGEGLLSLQFLMPSTKGPAGGTGEAFVEYRCLALDDSL